MKNKDECASTMFFYHGEYYSTFDEFVKGAIKFNSSKVDQKSIESLVDVFACDLKLNLSMNLPDITNVQLKERFDKMLDFLLSERGEDLCTEEFKEL